VRGKNIWNAAWLIALAAVAGGAIDFSRVSADSLRTNIAWLAADERGGRMTPSLGLDASADYIGAQFRLAGLEPAAPRGAYFQNAAFSEVTFKSNDFRMTLEAGTRSVDVTANSVEVSSLTALDLLNEPVLRLPGTGSLPEIQGHVVVGGEYYASERALYSLETGKPLLILLTIAGPRRKQSTPALMEADPSLPPVIRIYSRAAAVMLAGKAQAKLTLHVGQPVRHDVTLRNVAGILRGSDPALRDQFEIISAHYDHLGTQPAASGGRGKVYPGANDDASGVASLVEIAKVLAAEPHPKRSILFLALFGEEEGLFGSRYYVRHPLVPIAKTVAGINLEQLGRTDTGDGPEIAKFALSGPSYSNLESIMSPAAKTEGTTIYQKQGADDYFDRSDNYSFALAGIVAHTIVVAFEFKDYHAVTDEPGKIDYQNLAKVDRGIAAGVAAVANAPEAPKWSAESGFRNAAH
jgi:hypothetical protein